MRRFGFAELVLAGWIACSASLTVAHAQEEPKAENPTEAKIDLTVPKDKSPAELAKWIGELRAAQPQAATPDAALKWLSQSRKAMIEAAEVALAKNPEAPLRGQFLMVKLDSLAFLAQRQEPGALKQLADLGALVAQEKEPQLADSGRLHVVIARLFGVRFGNKQDIPLLLAATREFLGSGPMDGLRIQVAQAAAQTVELADEAKQASAAYSEFAGLIRKSEDPRLLPYAENFEAGGRRLGLLGQPLELVGATLAGEKFSLSSLKGKVVLVDFWATWCGPCRAELPNVKKNYEEYKDKGFEVVGISIDELEDRKKVEGFVAAENMTWINLFSDDPKASGWKNALAQQVGVSGIPTVILIDKEGKVITFNARGPALGEQLKKLLGSADDKRAPEKAPEKP